MQGEWENKHNPNESISDTNLQSGIVPRSVEMIFDALTEKKSPEWNQTVVQLSCVEIYCDSVQDLLDPRNREASYMTKHHKWKATNMQVRDKQDVGIIL